MYVFVRHTIVHMEDDVFVPLHSPLEVGQAQGRHDIVEVDQIAIVPDSNLDLKPHQKMTRLASDMDHLNTNEFVNFVEIQAE